MEPVDELSSRSNLSRMARAMALIAASVLTIAVAGFAYLNPTFGFHLPLPSSPAGSSLAPQLAAVDFVTPTTGWVAVELPPHAFAILHTSDAGETWSRQLAGPAGSIGEYMRFFDPGHGVVVLLGSQATWYETADGGRSWSPHHVTDYGGYVWCADCGDTSHGWLLAQEPTVGEALVRTRDGGKTWTSLGSPVVYSDWAYRVLFSNPTDGWLYSQSTGPYAYKSDDGGDSWRRVPLPEPAGGWPAAQGGAISKGEFFVAAQPTEGAGVLT